MKEAEYLGWSPDIKGETVRGHGDAKNWHYYRIKIANEDSFVVVKERENGDMLFHAIQDADHFKPEKIQNPRESGESVLYLIRLTTPRILCHKGKHLF